MTEFISRNYGNEGYEIIIKTDSHEHYRATEEFARRLIDHSKHVTNADKIRAMSDEELAAWMSECNAYREYAIASQWLPWLKQSAEEGER